MIERKKTLFLSIYYRLGTVHKQHTYVNTLISMTFRKKQDYFYKMEKSKLMKLITDP